MRRRAMREVRVWALVAVLVAVAAHLILSIATFIWLGWFY